MRALLLFLLGWQVAVQAVAARSVDFTCHLDGYFADPHDCTAYFECEYGQVTRQLCPGRLRWRSTGTGSGYCDLAVITPCRNQGQGQEDGEDENEGQADGEDQSEGQENGEDQSEGQDGGAEGQGQSDGEVQGDGGDQGQNQGQANGQEDEEEEKANVENGVSDSTGPFTCPDQGVGYHADPTDCNAFYHCHNGKEAKQKCPPHLRWRTSFPGSGYCDLAIITPCNEITAPEDQPIPPPVGEGTYEDSNSFKCPPDINGFFADPSRCGRFYLCVEGRSYAYNCPEGMHWTDRLESCDHAYKVACLKVLKYPPRKAKPSPVSPTEATTLTSEPEVTSDNGRQGGGGTPADNTRSWIETTSHGETTEGDDVTDGSGEADDVTTSLFEETDPTTETLTTRLTSDPTTSDPTS